MKEITAAVGSITWTSHLVNRKPAAKTFSGGGSDRNSAVGSVHFDARTLAGSVLKVRCRRNQSDGQPGLVGLRLLTLALLNGVMGIAYVPSFRIGPKVEVTKLGFVVSIQSICIFRHSYDEERQGTALYFRDFPDGQWTIFHRSEGCSARGDISPCEASYLPPPRIFFLRSAKALPRKATTLALLVFDGRKRSKLASVTTLMAGVLPISLK